MSTKSKVLTRVSVVVSIVAVVVGDDHCRELRSMDDGHFAVERERERRRKQSKRISPDKDACGLGSLC